MPQDNGFRVVFGYGRMEGFKNDGTVAEGPFDDATVAEIAGAIRVSDPKAIAHLTERLRELYDHIRLLRTIELPASPSDIAKVLRRAEAACRTLIDFLSIDTAAVPFFDLDAEAVAKCLVQWQLDDDAKAGKPGSPVHGPDPAEVLDRYVKTLGRLRDACRMALASMEERILPRESRARHRSDRALELAVEPLFDMYYEVTEKFPAITRGGPTVRFLSRCLPLLGWKGKSDEAIRSLIRDHRRHWVYRGVESEDPPS